MSANSESLSRAKQMTSYEYQLASWEAYDRRAAPPNLSALSDQTLQAFVHYEWPESLLPSVSRKALEAESSRREVDDVMALVMLAALYVSGLVIGLGLLVP